MSIKNIVFSVLAVAAFSSFSFAQGGQPNQPSRPNQPNQPPREGFGRMERRDFGRGFGMRRPGMMNFDRLNLTDAQKQRIQTILETNRRNMEATQTQREEMARLMMLKHQGLLTTEQGTRLTSLQAQMQTNAERARNEILAVLTPEQRTLFDQMRNDRGGQRRMMRDRMPMRRGPGGPIGPVRPGGATQAPPRVN
jgi:Spy/CpxP family protein refolding chaperone